MSATTSATLRPTTPDGVALVEHRAERREVTWRQLDDAADAVARGLSARGLVAGQRVAIVMANRIDLPIAYFGILRGGMVAVPINPRSTTREIGRMLADSLARVVLCDEAGVAQVREAVTDDHRVSVDRRRRQAAEGRDGVRDVPRRRGRHRPRGSRRRRGAGRRALHVRHERQAARRDADATGH